MASPQVHWRFVDLRERYIPLPSMSEAQVADYFEEVIGQVGAVESPTALSLYLASTMLRGMDRVAELIDRLFAGGRVDRKKIPEDFGIGRRVDEFLVGEEGSEVEG